MAGLLHATRPALGARVAFGKYGIVPNKRDPDYEQRMRIGPQNFGNGYYIPLSDFFAQSNERGRQGLLSTYSNRGSRSAERRLRPSEYQQWYREALGSLQYIDGVEYPESLGPEDLFPENDLDRPLMGRVPVMAEGKAAEFAAAVEELRRKAGRGKSDVVELLARYDVWAGEGEGGNDLLAGQPAPLYEALLLMCAEVGEWTNVSALLHEYAARGVQLRSVVAAALFSFVSTPQMALSLFDLLRKEGVRIHMRTYQALMSALDRLEAAETQSSLQATWKEKEEMTADMVDFITDGTSEQLVPETKPYLGRIGGRDARLDVDKALQQLLYEDRQVDAGLH